MTPFCYSRLFLLQRLTHLKACELLSLGDDESRKDGLSIVKRMVDRRELSSTWFLLKGNLALSFHVSSLEEAAMYLRDARRLYDQVMIQPDEDRSDPRLVAQLPAIAAELAQSRTHIIQRFVKEKGDGVVHGQDGG